MKHVLKGEENDLVNGKDFQQQFKKSSEKSRRNMNIFSYILSTHIHEPKIFVAVIS